MSKSLSSVFAKSPDTVTPEEYIPTLGNSVVDSDLYKAVVNYAYLTESKNGAVGVVVSLAVETSSQQKLNKTETFWITNRNKENFYVDKKTGQHITMPSYQILEELYGTITGNPLAEVADDIEIKTISIYDYNAKTEVPTDVEVITTLVNVPVGVIIQKILKNKSVSNGAGAYVDTPETIEVNSIVKFVDLDTSLTLSELVKKSSEPTYVNAWLRAYQGKVQDKRTIKDGGSSPAATSTATPKAATTEPTKAKKSLFDR